MHTIHQTEEEALRNYAKMVRRGEYDRPPDGLTGKFDNVRRFWEDVVTIHSLNRFLTPIVYQKQQQLSRIKVLDLGCGSGAGYEFITSAIGTSLLGSYKGVDISPEMINKGIELYGDNPKCAFEVADLNNDLPISDTEPPYDVIFSSYAALSHLTDDSLAHLLGNIFETMGKRIVFVMDVLGRYSYEWPTYWNEIDMEDGMHMYSMSYVYPEGLRDNRDVERFPCRFWGGHELSHFVNELAEECGVKIMRQEMHDRSVLVGRHMDTKEFNPFAPAMRAIVNSLLEPFQQTDLNQLYFDYHGGQEHPEIDRFFEKFQIAWNTIVTVAMDELMIKPRFDTKAIWTGIAAFPEQVNRTIHLLRRYIRQLNEDHGEDIIANWVEPQIARSLLMLEQEMEMGLGTGHGLIATYEFQRE